MTLSRMATLMPADSGPLDWKRCAIVMVFAMVFAMVFELFEMSFYSCAATEAMLVPQLNCYEPVYGKTVTLSVGRLSVRIQSNSIKSPPIQKDLSACATQCAGSWAALRPSAALWALRRSRHAQMFRFTICEMIAMRLMPSALQAQTSTARPPPPGGAGRRLPADI